MDSKAYDFLADVNIEQAKRTFKAFAKRLEPDGRVSVFDTVESVALPFADRIRFDKRVNPKELLIEMIEATGAPRDLLAPVIADIKAAKPKLKTPRSQRDRDRAADRLLNLVQMMREAFAV